MIKPVKKAGYEFFLPAITASIRRKKKSTNQISDLEFKAVVAVVFRDSVIRFMKESRLYRTEIPIDIYAGVDRYDIFPPEDWYIEAAIRLLTGKADLPKSYQLKTNELLFRNCCPGKDINKGLYVEVAIVPLRSSNVCEFDVVFLDKYYDAILAAMKWELAEMPGREWHNFGSVQYLRSQYLSLRNKAISGGTDSVKPVKLKYKRLSDGMSNTCSRIM